MNVRELPIDELIPYENNPRHNEDAVKVVAESIRLFGFKVPIVADKNNVRYAFKEVGLKLSQNLVWVKNALVPGRSDYQWRHEPILYGWKPGAPHSFFGDRTGTTVFEDVKSLNPASMKKAELVAYIKELQEREYHGSSVIKADKTTFNDDHPTMKPVKLIGKLIFNSSKHQSLILDSFGGSGSTLIAAEQAGRTCYMMELDPVYVDVIIGRWEKFTGQKAVKANG